MARVTLFNQEGVGIGHLDLADRLFGVSVNPAVVHEALVAQKANARVVLAHTKDRSEVAGSGKKPWKQKGTGRARHGSRRSPIWVGGGVTFGPTSDRNFSVKANKKFRTRALAMVLSDKVRNERFVALEKINLESNKTKLFAQMLSKLPVGKKNTLVILSKDESNISRAIRNMPSVTSISATSLNVADLLKANSILISKQTIEAITTTYQS